jgi:glutamate carboxypeptidase
MPPSSDAPADRYADTLAWIDSRAPALREELVRLANINSGSFNAGGVTAVARHMGKLFAPLGGAHELLDVEPYRSTADDGSVRERPLGRALRVRMRPNAPLKVFFCGHVDTVYGADHPFQTAQPIDADVLRGPGVADLKGGLLVMWLAIAALERSAWKERIGWEVLLNPDEEVGSPGSAPLLAEAAERNHFGLVYEPAFPDGNLASARKGSGNFDVIVRGRAAHAGRDFAAGRNAIAACAGFIGELNALNGQRAELTINPGYIRGGGAVNVVPELCVFRFNVRTTQLADEGWMLEQLQRLLVSSNAREGFKLELRGGFTRPPKPVGASMQRLMDLAGDCGKRLNLSLQFKPTGGCCDGNNLAAHGLPNLDNLGVVGGEIHSDREFMRYSSLAERAKLSALLLLRLASGELAWG